MRTVVSITRVHISRRTHSLPSQPHTELPRRMLVRKTWICSFRRRFSPRSRRSRRRRLISWQRTPRRRPRVKTRKPISAISSSMMTTLSYRCWLSVSLDSWSGPGYSWGSVPFDC